MSVARFQPFPLERLHKTQTSRRIVMENSTKTGVEDAGRSVVDGAKSIGQAMADGVGQAADWVQAKTGIGNRGVRERMDVIASCGKKVGVVDRIEGNAIKLTRNDSPDGMHHYIPLDWVESVDGGVRLTRNSMETESGWKSDPSSCGCGT
jgi:hypothetical protein